MNSTSEILLESSTKYDVVTPVTISLHYFCLIFLIFLLMVANKLLSRFKTLNDSPLPSINDSNMLSLNSSITKLNRMVGGAQVYKKENLEV